MCMKGILKQCLNIAVEYVNKTMPMNYFLFPHCFDTSHTRAGKKSSKSDTSKHWHVFIGMKLSSISRSVLSVVYLARALSLGAAADYLFREIKHWQIYEEVIRTAQNQFATPFCFKTLTNFMSPEIAHKTPDVYQIVDISSTWYKILVNNCDIHKTRSSFRAHVWSC